jgi:D-alanine-D-alanine ligase
MSGEGIVVSEINTIPGFTPISLFPTMPTEGGYSFTDICVRIVELAVERHARRPATRLRTADLPR